MQYDEDRAGRVRADRPEQHADETAVPAATDHEQVRACRSLDQYLRRVTFDGCTRSGGFLS